MRLKPFLLGIHLEIHVLAHRLAAAQHPSGEEKQKMALELVHGFAEIPTRGSEMFNSNRSNQRILMR